MAAGGQGAMRPAGRFIRIVAIFLLIGPPSGGIAFSAAGFSMSLLHGGFSPADFDIPRELRGMSLIILLSYPIGGPFALACGIVHAVSAIWLRWNSVWVPLIASAMLVAVFMLVRPPDGMPPLKDFIAIVAPMFAASLICWRLSRHLLLGA
jgi:hypothetical protein